MAPGSSKSTTGKNNAKVKDKSLRNREKSDKDENSATDSPESNNADLDASILQHTLTTKINNVKQILSCMEKGTREIKDLLLNECNIIYECRVCSNLFRGLTNFLYHKRSYCTKHLCEELSLFDDVEVQPSTSRHLEKESPSKLQMKCTVNLVKADLKDLHSTEAAEISTNKVSKNVTEKETKDCIEEKSSKKQKPEEIAQASSESRRTRSRKATITTRVFIEEPQRLSEDDDNLITIAIPLVSEKMNVEKLDEPLKAKEKVLAVEGNPAENDQQLIVSETKSTEDIPVQIDVSSTEVKTTIKAIKNDTTKHTNNREGEEIDLTADDSVSETPSKELLKRKYTAENEEETNSQVPRKLAKYFFSDTCLKNTNWFNNMRKNMVIAKNVKLNFPNQLQYLPRMVIKPIESTKCAVSQMISSDIPKPPAHSNESRSENNPSQLNSELKNKIVTESTKETVESRKEFIKMPIQVGNIVQKKKENVVFVVQKQKPFPLPTKPKDSEFTSSSSETQVDKPMKLITRSDCNLSKLKCLVCNSIYNSVRTLTSHMMSHAKKRLFFPCPYCSLTSDKMYALNRHLKVTHNITKEEIHNLEESIRMKGIWKKVEDYVPPDGYNLFQTQIEDSAGNDNKNGNASTPEKIYSSGEESKSDDANAHRCTKCQRVFSRKSSQVSHEKFCVMNAIKVDSNNFNQPSTSTVTSRKEESAEMKRSIQLAKDTLNGVNGSVRPKRIATKRIHKDFVNSQTLRWRSANRVRNTAKPLPSKVMTPLKKQSNVLESAVLRMMNPESLKCLRCNKEFSSYSNLRRHAAIHVGWKRFKCKLCDYQVYNKSQCWAHLQKSHNVPEKELDNFVVSLAMYFSKFSEKRHLNKILSGNQSDDDKFDENCNDDLELMFKNEKGDDIGDKSSGDGDSDNDKIQDDNREFIDLRTSEELSDMESSESSIIESEDGIDSDSVEEIKLSTKCLDKNPNRIECTKKAEVTRYLKETAKCTDKNPNPIECIKKAEVIRNVDKSTKTEPRNERAVMKATFSAIPDESGKKLIVIRKSISNANDTINTSKLKIDVAAQNKLSGDTRVKLVAVNTKKVISFPDRNKSILIAPFMKPVNTKMKLIPIETPVITIDTDEDEKDIKDVSKRKISTEDIADENPASSKIAAARSQRKSEPKDNTVTRSRTQSSGSEEMKREIVRKRPVVKKDRRISRKTDIFLNGTSKESTPVIIKMKSLRMKEGKK